MGGYGLCYYDMALYSPTLRTNARVQLGPVGRFLLLLSMNFLRETKCMTSADKQHKASMVLGCQFFLSCPTRDNKTYQNRERVGEAILVLPRGKIRSAS